MKRACCAFSGLFAWALKLVQPFYRGFTTPCSSQEAFVCYQPTNVTESGETERRCDILLFFLEQVD